MSQSDYTLTTAELPALRQFFQLQNLLGVGAPDFSDKSILQLMSQLDALSAIYPQLSNAKFKGWVDQLYSLLLSADTCFKVKFPALYTTYHYANFGFPPDQEFISFDINPTGKYPVHGGFPVSKEGGEYKPKDTTWDWTVVPTNIQGTDDKTYSSNALDILFLQGGKIAYHASGPWTDYSSGRTWTVEWDAKGPARSPWAIPQAPDAWKTAVASLVANWVKDPNQYTAFLLRSSFAAFGKTSETILQQNLSSSKWTDVAQLKTAVAPVWQAQSTLTASLVQQSSLAADAYFFLLHLLISLGTSNTNDQQLAQKIVILATTSVEYPNDTFINQLVYLTLMYLADPLGDYGWNHAQLQALVQDLQSAIVAKDPASTAIKTSLGQQAKVLYSASSYPMVDPYCPSIGFSQRKTDTLFALDKARATMNQTIAS
jgi:hypothetical protein